VLSALETNLQQTLEILYRIDGTLSVTDFRIDGEVLEGVLGEGACETHRETLVVREAGEETDLALYIADEVVVRAHAFVEAKAGGAADPLVHLDAFCVATEGVSHFVYLTFCGTRQLRPVSQIELEIQAEIDKYLVLRVLFTIPGTNLVSRLFDRFRLAERLTSHEQERYQVANRAGRRYARWLEREFSKGRGAQALDDARSLYRKPLAAKLEHIERAA
jgi:hypothetical protein